jgi:hypothetical protein
MHASNTLADLAVALAAFAMASSALATAQRTFVSASANDSNPCSLTQPCRSFAAAIAHTNPGGEVVVLDSAGYGPVAIADDVSLIAPPGIHAGISVFAGAGVTINAPTATVVLRGIAIDGQGGTHGVNVQAAQRVRIENCIISNMTGNGLNLTSANTETIVADTTIRGNGLGIALTVPAKLVLDRVRVEQNLAQGLSISSAPASANLTATITDSAFNSNGQEGISITPPSNTTARVQVEHTVISFNGGVGVLVSATAGGALATVTLMRSTIAHNGSDGVFAAGSGTGAFALVYLAANLIDANHGNGVRVTGLANALISTNVFSESIGTTSPIECMNGAHFLSQGNNDLLGTLPSGCYQVIGGV